MELTINPDTFDQRRATGCCVACGEPTRRPGRPYLCGACAASWAVCSGCQRCLSLDSYGACVTRPNGKAPYCQPCTGREMSREERRQRAARLAALVESGVPYRVAAPMLGYGSIGGAIRVALYWRRQEVTT